MSKFKPGALVMLLRSRNAFCDPFVGSVQTLRERTPDAGAWFFDPPAIAFDGLECGWSEPNMKLIDPGSGTDEMLLKVGMPESNGLEVLS
ncbi:hypothetical protein F3K02_09055 [Hydrogenophaga sp. D2P1]|uniref:Uncharacterized protein n=1 Tax=Hydrogenophaga aromaticivorans TaxID=2610898 RepID=A0A7Y8GWP5_9BURK|nr:hypothetical protein [Hydrogenophaga aromaticivorans]NWF45393.1 hypothetical protein [Hydrogenophaga aromaticivorans]